MRVLNMKQSSPSILVALLSFKNWHIAESALFPASPPPKLKDLNSTVDLRASDVKAEDEWQPVVYVQDFLPYFPAFPPPKLSDLNLKMSAIYGYPVCPGNDTFVRAEDAPPDFCRYSNGQATMAMQGQRRADFDQYAMERVMLAKWLTSPLRCRGEPAWCKARADIVVVPSLRLHGMMQDGFTWELYTNRTGSAAYWATVREMFYKPEMNRTPLIVTHSAFSWRRRSYNKVLHTLANEPEGFVQRVVIASTGSNLMHAERRLFRENWNDGGVSLLRQRFEQRRSGGVATDGGPLLLTVPYPTSLLNRPRFTQSQGAYSAEAKRPIRVSLYAAADKDGGGLNWIRQLLLERVSSMPYSVTHSDVTMVCDESVSKARGKSTCGVARDSPANMWTITSNSAFCLEPAGDTLCRSHFYVALLSGCIPVIVDGGHDGFDPKAPTWWAWRGTSRDLSSPSPLPHELQSALVDYNESFVVISADDVRAGTDHIQTLVDMPEKDPERYKRLRENVDRIAPLMRYSFKKCSTYPWSAHPNWCRDAFSVFQSVVALESYYAHH